MVSLFLCSSKSNLQGEAVWPLTGAVSAHKAPEGSETVMNKDAGRNRGELHPEEGSLNHPPGKLKAIYYLDPLPDISLIPPPPNISLILPAPSQWFPK